MTVDMCEDGRWIELVQDRVKYRGILLRILGLRSARLFLCTQYTHDLTVVTLPFRFVQLSRKPPELRKSVLDIKRVLHFPPQLLF
jgi:hypothetical protein